MQIEIFTVCDAATVESGKVNLLGSFDSVSVPSFPARHGYCVVAWKVRLAEEDSGEHRLSIRFIDPDGRDVLDPHCEVVRVDLVEGQTKAFVGRWQILHFQMSKPGEFFVDLLWDDIVTLRLPFYVKVMES